MKMMLRDDRRLSENSGKILLIIIFTENMIFKQDELNDGFNVEFHLQPLKMLARVSHGVTRPSKTLNKINIHIFCKYN